MALVARLRQLRPAPLVFAVPNGGGRTRYWGRRLKAEGVKRGVSDLVVLEPRGPHHGLVVELKKPGGAASDEQLEFLAACRERGYCALLAQEGLEAAWRDVQRYLALPSGPLTRAQSMEELGRSLGATTRRARLLS